MKDKNLLISFLTIVFVGTFVLSSLSMTPPQNDIQSGIDPLGGFGKKVDYSLLKNSPITGTVAHKDISKGEKETKKTKSIQALGLNWAQRGPDNIAGRAKSIIVDNRDATGKTLFAGSVAGGIWKSLTGGLTWNQVDCGGINLNVSCMVQASNGDIYAGSGDYYYNFLNTPTFLGRGIFKSSDGNTFSLLESTNPSLEWNFINALAIDKSSSRLYAANDDGIKYSDNGGVNWNPISSTTGAHFSGNLTDVNVASDGTTVVSINGQCWISQNGDPNNFQSISNDTLAGLLPSTGIGRIKFAFAPSDPKILYALAASSATSTLGALKNVYKSTDKGSTWTIIGPGGSPNFDPFSFHEGNYASTITVFPNDPNRILIAGSIIWEGKKVLETGYYQWEQRFVSGQDIHSLVFAPNNPDVIYVAADFGLLSFSSEFKSGKTLNKTFNTSQFNSVAFSHNNEELIGGTQGFGSVYIDGKGNSPETAFPLLNVGFGGYTEISQIDPKVFIFSGERANLYRSNDKGVSISEKFMLAAGIMPGNSLLINPFVLWESFNNDNSRDSIIFYAKQNYRTDTTIIVHSENGKYPFNYTLPISLASGDSIKIKDIVSSKFFLGVPGGIYMTKHVHDFTKVPDWDKISTIIGEPMSLAYSKDANYLFVGTSTGKLYRISNIALAYNSLRADVSSPSCIIATSLIHTYEGRSITSISVDPANAAHILVTLGNYGSYTSYNDYIYYCTNALDEFPTFVSAQGNLPKVSIYTSLIDMNSSNTVIIGTSYGIFTTGNLGSSAEWTKENTGMGEIPVMMVRQQTLDRPWSQGIDITKNLGVIYAATYGRGLFESRSLVSVAEQTGVVTKKSFRIYPNPADGSVKILFKNPSTANVSVRIYDLAGHLLKSVNVGVVKTGEQEFELSTTDIERGSYLVQLITGNTSQSAKLVIVR